MTDNMLQRAGKELAGIAGVPCDVQDISGTIYVFTDELGSLRLFNHYNCVKRNEKTSQGYSENRKTWYFGLEVNV